MILVGPENPGSEDRLFQLISRSYGFLRSLRVTSGSSNTSGRSDTKDFPVGPLSKSIRALPNPTAALRTRSRRLLFHKTNQHVGADVAADR
jgi:hypothetical protein